MIIEKGEMFRGGTRWGMEHPDKIYHLMQSMMRNCWLMGIQFEGCFKFFKNLKVEISIEKVKSWKGFK